MDISKELRLAVLIDADNVPYSNIKGVLEVLKTKKYPIPAMIEYEYGKPGMDAVAEVKKCFDYCKSALA